MNKPIDNSGGPEPELPLGIQILLCLAGLGLAAAGLYYAYITPTMSGEAMPLWKFVLGFARELIFFGFFGLAFILAIIARSVGTIVHAVRRLVHPEPSDRND